MKYFFYLFAFSVFIFLVCTEIHAQQDDRIELTSINFVGNNSFSSSDLEEILQSKETPWWFWKFLDSFTPLGSPPNYFDSTTITLDLISLKSLYAVNGFFKADISYKYEIDSLDKTAELTYFINERDMHLIGNDTKAYGLENLYREYVDEVNSIIKYPVGERFIQSRIQTMNEELIIYLNDHGYMLAKYDSTVIRIDTTINRVNAYTYFTLGKRYFYSGVKIEKSGVGKDLVSDELIKYLSDFNPGELYRENEISKSRVRLARTGLFTSVNVRNDVKDTTGNRVPISVTGNIGTLNELSPEVFGDNELNTFNLGVGTSYIRKNLFGDARKLTLRARFRLNDIANVDVGNLNETFQSEIELTGSVEQPFLFSRRISGKLEGYLKSYNISLIDYINYGVEFTSTVDMPSYTFVNLFNPFIRFDRLSYDLPNLVVDTLTLTASPRSLTSSIGTEIGSTNTDDFFYPTQGRTISLITELSSANVKYDFTDANTGLTVDTTNHGYYLKFQLTLGFYFSVSNDHRTVFGIKAKSGYISMLSGDPSLVAPNQTFFAGGSNSVRGWQSRELVPANKIGNFLPSALNEQYRIRGGIFLLEGSFEYRRKFEDDLGFAVFVDYGNTWNALQDFRYDQVAVATGLGLRYYSPIAPFRLDFVFKFYDPADKKFIFDKKVFNTLVFHFGIGEAF